jgi:pimeloyl-ACP methyl ester carboxylesterase
LAGFDWGARTVDIVAALCPERWHTASPKWNFDDATFDRSAESFDNPDHVDIVIHNYRWRLGLAEGEAEYDALENRLAEGPVITVPAITLEVTPTAHPIRTRVRTPRNSRAGIRTGRSRAASGTTFPRKPRRPLPRPSSKGTLISKTATDTAPLTVVFVHGPFADASSWNGVIQRVQAAGIQVTAPAIPLRGIAHDSAYVASFLNQVPGPGLAVGHSYGGAVISNAATAADNVVGLVFVAAFAPEESERLGEVEATSKDSVLMPAFVRSSIR